LHLIIVKNLRQADFLSPGNMKGHVMKNRNIQNIRHKKFMCNYYCHEFFMSLSNKVYIFSIQTQFWRPSVRFSDLVIRHKIFEMLICTIYQKIRKTFFFVFELFLKNRKKIRSNPHWSPWRLSISTFCFADYSFICSIAFTK